MEWSADGEIRVGKALAQARAAKMKPDGKSMTQKDLATAVNAKPQDVSIRSPIPLSLSPAVYIPCRVYPMVSLFQFHMVIGDHIYTRTNSLMCSS
jgi:hypothetical protein